MDDPHILSEVINFIRDYLVFFQNKFIRERKTKVTDPMIELFELEFEDNNDHVILKFKSGSDDEILRYINYHYQIKKIYNQSLFVPELTQIIVSYAYLPSLKALNICRMIEETMINPVSLEDHRLNFKFNLSSRMKSLEYINDHSNDSYEVGVEVMWKGLTKEELKLTKNKDFILSCLLENNEILN